MSSLEGKVAIITGAGSGIGRAAALAFASEGADMVIVGRRVAPLEAVAAEIEDIGRMAIVHSVDLEDGDAAAAVTDVAIKHFGKVDILVNNAGHSSKGRSIFHVGIGEWESVYRINVEAVFRLTQTAVRDMVKRGEGTVITVSSIAAITPGPLGGAAYCSAKAASYTLMRSMNEDLRQKGIRTCTILPGEVNTPIMDYRPLPPSAEARATMMHPEDVAAAILLCATMPQRTQLSEIRLLPTKPRDTAREVKVAVETKSEE
jgi:NADP-dependent 3-hydroxy acid dehydrogenase YdfG